MHHPTSYLHIQKIHIHTRIHTRIHPCIYVHIYIPIHKHTLKHSLTHTHLLIHTYIHAYMHTYHNYTHAHNHTHLIKLFNYYTFTPIQLNIALTSGRLAARRRRLWRRCREPWRVSLDRGLALKAVGAVALADGDQRRPTE